MDGQGDDGLGHIKLQNNRSTLLGKEPRLAAGMIFGGSKNVRADRRRRRKPVCRVAAHDSIGIGAMQENVLASQSSGAVPKAHGWLA
jgi:hypothetical protein